MGRSSRGESGPRATTRQRLGALVLAAIVLGSGLALGAIHTPVLAACAIAACGAAVLLAPTLEGASLGREAKLLLYTAIGLTVWTALQLVPVPQGLLELVAGESADVWSRCLRPLHESGPRAAPISVDPDATLVQVLRGLTYLAVLVAALAAAQRRAGRTFLQRLLIIASIVMAAAAVAHPALDVHRVFLLYEPKEGFSYDHIAPLLNVNHLAAYVNIGMLLALASLFEQAEEAALPRPVAIVTVLLLAATTAWTGSRGGFATLVGGTLLVLVLSYRRYPIGKARVATAVGAVIIGAALLLASFDTTRSKLAQNDLSKLTIAREALQLLHGYGVLGAGRGTFESVFPKLHTGTDYFVFTHPENIFVQWTTEWGVPIGVAALATIVWALRPQRIFSRVRPPLGAWAALVAVGAQNLVDFSSEIPGVVVALTLCCAIVTGGSTVQTDDDPRYSINVRRALLGGGLALVGLVAGIAVVRAPYELFNERRSFMATGLDRALGRDQFHAAAREVMLRHPADAYFPFVGAVHAATAHDESIMPWAEQALERSPTYGRVHLLIARSLHARNRSQARLEYRIACTEDGVACALPETLSLIDGFDDAIELVPDGQHTLGELGFLITGIDQRLPSTAIRLGQEVTRIAPMSSMPFRQVARAELSDVRNDEPWCSNELKTRCLEDGARAAASLITVMPDTCEGYAVRADLRAEGGDPGGAFDELDAATSGVQDRMDCTLRLLDLAKRSHDNALIDRATARLEKLACSADECKRALVAASQAEVERGNERRSLALLTRAWEDSGDDALLQQVASRAEAQGLHGQALDAYEKLAVRQPDEKKWPAAIQRERAAAASHPLPRVSP